MAIAYIHGLVNNNDIYLHYKRQHFDWHKKNSPDYDFSGTSDNYVKLNRQRYQSLATAIKPIELENIKNSSKKTDDVFKAINTFSSDNVQVNLDLITQEIQSLVAEATNITENKYSLVSDVSKVQVYLNKIEEVVDKMELISNDLLLYIQQDKQKRQNIRIQDRNLFVIKKEEVNAFQGLRDSILSLKRGLRGPANNMRKVPFLLTGLANQIKKVAEDMIQSMAYYAAQEKIKEKTFETKGNVKVTVSNYPILERVTIKSDNIRIGYSKQNAGIISFDMPYGDIKDESRTLFNPFSNNSITINKYLNKLSWEARYLMYNNILFDLPYEQRIYSRYAASFAIEDILRQKLSTGDYIFLKIDDKTIVPLSSFYSTVASLRTAQPILKIDKHNLKSSNVWVGNQGKEVTDDEDESRPIFAWIRARRLNDAFLRLRATLTFPQGRERRT